MMSLGPVWNVTLYFMHLRLLVTPGRDYPDNRVSGILAQDAVQIKPTWWQDHLVTI